MGISGFRTPFELNFRSDNFEVIDPDPAVTSEADLDNPGFTLVYAMDATGCP